jgi:hypothetical protein
MRAIGKFLLFIVGMIGASSGHAVDRFRPLPLGPQHFFYYAYPTYTPDSAQVRAFGEWGLDFDFTHSNVIGQSTNVGVDVGVGGTSTGLDFEFKHCGYFNPQSFQNFDWNCKNQGYSIRQDGEILRRGWSGSLGIGARFEFQASTREMAFRGGELDQFIEDFHSAVGMSNHGRDEFPQNEFGIYVWDNEEGQFVYRLDPNPESGYRPEARTYTLKFGLIQGDSVAIAFKYGIGADQEALRYNEVTEQQQEPRTGEDRLWSLDTSIRFDGWAFHWGYAQTKLAKAFLPKSPEVLLFHFYALIGLWGEDKEWFFQDLTYTSMFPKDGRETLYHDLRERTLGLRFRFGDSFTWRFGLANNVTWQPQNIDASFYSGLGLEF